MLTEAAPGMLDAVTEEDFRTVVQVNAKMRGINLLKHGDEWVHHILERLSETTSCTGHSSRWSHDPYPQFALTPKSPSLTSTLLVHAPRNEPPSLFILFPSEPIKDEIESWTDAINYGITKTGTWPTFNWHGVIGVAPSSIGRSPLQFDSPFQFGGFRFDPSPKKFYEYRRIQGQIFQSGFNESALVHARGSAAGYSPDVAIEEAAKKLRLACALLSLATGSCWTVRSSPQINRMTSEGYQPHEDLKELPEWNPYDSQHEVVTSGHTQLIDAPEWLAGSWEQLEGDVQLADLLLAFHEGLLLREEHPSFACIAFVAVIETIGNMGIELPRCENLNCRNVIGSTERFRAALRQVLPAEQANKLGSKIYRYRSTTAHTGTLHGTERVIGPMFPIQFLTEKSSQTFNSLVLSLVRTAQRLLLQKLQITSEVETFWI